MRRHPFRLAPLVLALAGVAAGSTIQAQETVRPAMPLWGHGVSLRQLYVLEGPRPGAGPGAHRVGYGMTIVEDSIVATTLARKHREIFADQDGRIWIGIDWMHDPIFDVFDRAGRLLGTVALPYGSTLWAARNDRVYARSTGPEGEERLIAYQLTVRDPRLTVYDQ